MFVSYDLNVSNFVIGCFYVVNFLTILSMTDKIPTKKA